MRMTKEHAEEVLRGVGGNERFFNADGSVCASLKELAERLPQMPQETFNHHCSSQKCDFASWVEEVLHDPVLAKSLRAAKGIRAKVEKALADRVSQLEKHFA